MNTMRTIHDTYRNEVDSALLSIETRKSPPHFTIRYFAGIFCAMADINDFDLSSYDIASMLDRMQPPGSFRLSTPLQMCIIRDTQHIILSLRDPYCEEVYMPPRHTHVAKRLKKIIEYLLRTYAFSDSTIKILKKKKDRCKQILAEEPGVTDEEIFAEVERYSEMKY